MADEELRTTAGRLERARLFIRKAYGRIDPELPALLEVLENVGAAECWHKHSTFFDHLVNVYRTLKLWGVADSVARCGLFHSSYSNSYVNLALFAPDVDRQKVRDLIGSDAEELVHWFCVVPRQHLIFDLLLSQHGAWSDGHGPEHSEAVGKAAHDKRATMLVPPEGLLVKHIRTGEDLLVPRRLIAIFLILTIADFSDQWFSWQDRMFGNADGELDFSGDDGTPLWPGDGRPGLWITCLSRMGVVLSQILKDEEELEASGDGEASSRPFSHIEIRVPPVLKHCSATVSAADQVKAQALYWEAVCGKEGGSSAKACLMKAIEHNRYIGEPHIVLAQILLSEGNWEEAEKQASEGLELLLEWCTAWDKRMNWEAWIAWARVLKKGGEDRAWPKSGWGLNNLGLVKT